jgi:transketolase
MTYSDLGGTHQSLEDNAILRTIPNVTIINPGDPVEIEKAVIAMVEYDGPVYLRIGSPAMPVIHDGNYEFTIGKAETLKAGNDVTVIAAGTTLVNAYDACEVLEKEGITARLINLHTIKPIDVDTIVRAAEETGKIVTVEEGFLNGGLGGAVAEVCAKHRPTPIKMIGIDDEFVSNGPYEGLIGMYGLQSEQIAATVRAFLK